MRARSGTWALVAFLLLAGCGGGSGGSGGACLAHEVRCGSSCVDPLTDRAFCGADASCAGYTACPPGQVCGDGQCATSCPGGQVDCGGRCVDPLTDRVYCGADPSCDGYTSCAPGQVCADAHCATSCPAGEYACGGRCVDPLSDRVYCGASADCTGGTACGSGSFCDAGTCWSPCGAGQAFCGQRCIDPSLNRGHCGASGLCAGAASGVRCAADHVCTAGSCACPPGQTECAGVCRFGGCGAATPDWEWNGNVALTRPPLFSEPPTVLAHVVFDGVKMEDLTGNTTWTATPAAPPAGASGVWDPAQASSGPFTASSFWLGTPETGAYLAGVTSGPFTVCARYRPGRFPLAGGTNKIIFSLGKPEYMPSTPDARLGGWALMQMHASSCFHYYGLGGGEWMAPAPWTLDAESARSIEWSWQCGGWDGSSLASLHDSFYSRFMMRNDGGSAPFEPGFPVELELPSIGAYPDGTGPLEDGQVYELIVTSDPATEGNMKNLVARAAGGLRLENPAPVPVTGADGRTHLGPPGTVALSPDGAVLGDQSVLLGAALPDGWDPEASGQCWGVEATAARWNELGLRGTLLAWTSADGARRAEVGWAGRYSGVYAGAPYGGWVRAPLADGTRHVFHYCFAPDRSVRMYVDGEPQGDPDPAPPGAALPHPEEPGSSLALGVVDTGLKIWRVFACDGTDPADCP